VVRYLHLDTGFVPEELVSKVQECAGIVPLDEEHKALTDYVCASFGKNGIEDLSECVLRAASLRRFLGRKGRGQRLGCRRCVTG
jgi:hypothetical protein